jgi:hypothetical protein
MATDGDAYVLAEMVHPAVSSSIYSVRYAFIVCCYGISHFAPARSE